MTPTPPLYIVLNAGSGGRRVREARQAIDAACAAAGRPQTIFQVDQPALLKESVRRAVEQARVEGGIVVAAGGDGTINGVAQAAWRAGCAFGVLPQGTFNYFSREHGVPADIDDALKLLLTGQPRAVNVGLVNDRVFLVNASLGMYARLLEQREDFKQVLGRHRWTAITAGIVTLLRGVSLWHLRITWRGQEREFRTPTLFVGNNTLQMLQVGLPVAGAIEQGQLAAVVLKPAGALSLIALGLAAARHDLGESDALSTFTFESIRLRAPDSKRAGRIKVATDGEIDWAALPLEIRVAPQPLWLIRPEHAPEVEAAKAHRATEAVSHS
ncbi:MAG: diacylglycerol kinase family protein [Variovorax sp.]